MCSRVFSFFFLFFFSFLVVVGNNDKLWKSSVILRVKTKTLKVFEDFAMSMIFYCCIFFIFSFFDVFSLLVFHFFFIFSFCSYFMFFIFFLERRTLKLKKIVEKVPIVHFFIFGQKCFFSFLFLFKYVLLLASVSGCDKRCSSVVGAPWRCGVLTTKGGKAGIGSDHLSGREHDSIPQSGVEAPRLLKRSLPR